MIETSDSNKALYDRNLEYGHMHPDQIKYPAHALLKQGPNAYGFYQYIWGNLPSSQDSYNAAKEYAENANSYPIFVRSYRVLRSDYLVTGPLTKGIAFTGIVAVSVTAGGTGYTKDFAATIAGTGTGANALAIVSRGAVVRVEITAVGTGYTGTPTCTFGSGDGAGATATAIIQPASAVLVSEKHSKLPEDDPYSSLYDRVTRVYETLPGATVTTAHIDSEMDVKITTSKTRDLLTNITEGSAISGVAPNQTLVVTEREGSDGITATKVVTTIPLPAARDSATAVPGSRTMPFQFPARIDIGLLDLYGTAIGHQEPHARLIEASVKTWWEISATKPTLTFDVIIPQTIWINDVKYTDVLHDATVRTYAGIPVAFPATTPSNSEYVASWIGQQKVMDGSVTATKWQKLWKVESLSLTMR